MKNKNTQSNKITMKRSNVPALVLLAIALLVAPCFTGVFAQTKAASFQKGYAPVNGLKMYYEIHGQGEPLVLLHGAYMTIEGPIRDMAKYFAGKNRQVIAVELQGHGRTADIDRPITTGGMADDVAALLKHLKIKQADVLGYSMGGGAALQLAVSHPEVIRKLVVVSAVYNNSGMYPELLKLIPTLTPEMFEGSPWKTIYDSIAPNPKDFPKLMAKLKKLDELGSTIQAEQLKAFKAPVLIVIGDADATKPEHAVEMLRLFGGGVMGDLAGVPKARLAVLPGTTHVGAMGRPEWLNPMVEVFLDEKIQ
jgi:pimeloyl-ACP methyl ester carboxylesterase